MSDKICPETHPTTFDVLATFCMLRGGYVEFDYKPLPECKKKKTASVIHAQESTEYIAPLEKVRGYLDEAKMTKAGEFTIILRNMNRRVKDVAVDTLTGEIYPSYFIDKSNKQADGTRKIGFDDGEYEFRQFRLDVRGDGKGVQLHTVKANLGGMKQIFPHVEPVAV